VTDCAPEKLTVTGTFWVAVSYAHGRVGAFALIVRAGTSSNLENGNIIPDRQIVIAIRFVEHRIFQLIKLAAGIGRKRHRERTMLEYGSRIIQTLDELRRNNDTLEKTFLILHVVIANTD
jgi:hypothetical protein